MTTEPMRDLDGLVVGAGYVYLAIYLYFRARTETPANTSFGGIYQLKKLLDQGLDVQLIDAAGDVGGTWYWNRT